MSIATVLGGLILCAAPALIYLELREWRREHNKETRNPATRPARRGARQQGAHQ